MRQYLARHSLKVGFGLLFTLLMVWLQTSGDGWGSVAVNRLDHLAYDLRLNYTLPSARTDARVIIVDIDEASLRAEGRWPWSRQKIGELVIALKSAGAQSIGFDVAFTEPERNVAQELITAATRSGRLEHKDYLEQLIPDMDWDKSFAEQLKGQGVVLGFMFHSAQDSSVGRLPSPWSALPAEQAATITVPLMQSYTGNLPALQKAARQGGFLNTTTDIDGVLRSTPLILRHGDLIYPSLSLALARQSTHTKRFQITTARAGPTEPVTGLLLGDTLINTDRFGRVLIPYLGKRRMFPYISATDILRAGDAGQFPQLANSVAIVGASALGLGDIISTPTDPAYPGVEVHATVLQTILDGESFPRVPDWSDAATALLIALFGVALTLLCPLFGALPISLLATTFIGLLLGSNVWLWSSAKLSLSPILPLVTIVAIVAFNVLYGYFIEARQKQQVRKAFSAYMAPALVEQLVNDPSGLKLKGESREMTFLFSDIAGFTAFTEGASPEELVSALNEYLDAVCRCVMDHGGTIDKIVGDAVVGIFNAPMDQPDHAARAVSCALQLDRISRGFNERYATKGKTFGHTRVGVNTGVAIVGNFGGSERFDYTAHGDPINTAARMESVNKHLGTLLCVSGTTVAQCPDHFFRPVGGLILKGKTEAIDAFEPITEQESRSEFILQYSEAFAHLQREERDTAELFARLREQYPEDPLIKLHHERIVSGVVSATIVLTEK